MNKQQYLSTLKNMLKGIQEEDRNEILYDYEEHFRMGMENGKSEEEVSQSLGDVRMIARQFIADYSIKRAETSASTGNILRAVLAIGALGFFNLVFVMGPFLGVVGVLLGLFAAAAGMVLSGIAVFFAVCLFPIFPGIINFGGVSPAFLITSSVGVTGLGLLLFIGCCYLTKFVYKGSIRYLKWNLELIIK